MSATTKAASGACVASNAAALFPSPRVPPLGNCETQYIFYSLQILVFRGKEPVTKEIRRLHWRLGHVWADTNYGQTDKWWKHSNLACAAVSSSNIRFAHALSCISMAISAHWTNRVTVTGCSKKKVNASIKKYSPKHFITLSYTDVNLPCVTLKILSKK